MVVEVSLVEPWAWYLREQPTTFAPRVEPGAKVLIARGEAPRDGNFDGYSQALGVTSYRWRPPALEAGALWRWALLRQGAGQAERQTFVLYSKAQG